MLDNMDVTRSASTGYTRTPWETISAALSKLKMAQSGVEGTTTSSPRFYHKSTLAEWDMDDELKEYMVAMRPLFDAFATATDADTASLLELENRHLKTAEHLVVVAEIDMDGRFKNNAASAARAVVYTLNDASDGLDVDNAPPLLKNINLSSSKG